MKKNNFSQDLFLVTCSNCIVLISSQCHLVNGFLSKMVEL